MKAHLVGPNSWLLNDGESRLWLNPCLGTVRSAADFVHSFRNLKSQFSISGGDNLLELYSSDQFQFFDPKLINAAKYSKLVPQTSVLPFICDCSIDVIKNHTTYRHGSMNVTVFGNKYPGKNWDNTGVSVFVESCVTGTSFFYQGSNALDAKRPVDFPGSCDLSVITWNTYKTIGKASAFSNLYFDEEFYSLDSDAANFISYLNKAPVSRNVTLQGNEFYNNGESNSRKSLDEWTLFFDPYMVGTDLLDIKPGDGLNLATMERCDPLIGAPLVSEYDGISQGSSTNFDVSRSFLTSLASVVLLTDFGREVFGCSRVGSSLTSSKRFCILLESNDEITNGYEFDICTCDFHEIAPLGADKALQLYPFGAVFKLDALVQICEGFVDPWQVLNSDAFRQWYLCDPGNAPATLFYQFWKELRSKERFRKYITHYA